MWEGWQPYPEQLDSSKSIEVDGIRRVEYC